MNVKFSRIQAIGIRSGAPLTGNAEGDDIVYALMKIRDCKCSSSRVAPCKFYLLTSMILI